MHFEQTYRGMMLEFPVNNAPYNVGSILGIVWDRIAVSDRRSTMINKHEDLEVDHADELT